MKTARVTHISYGTATVYDRQGKAHRLLERLRSFKGWDANWDREGALAPRLDAIDAAGNLVGFLANEGIRPSVALDTLGRPVLVFRTPIGEGEVIVENKNRLSFSVDTPKGEVFQASARFDGSALPARLRSALTSLHEA